MVAEKPFKNLCVLTKAPGELSILTASLMTIFTFTNIPGNVLIILAVVLDPNKKLRSPFNWLLVNLATADLLIGIILQPVAVNLHIKDFLGEKIIPGEIITVHMVFYISCTASVLSISSLAVERYVAIRRPNKYRSSVTNKRVVFTIAGIWLLSLCLPSIYFKVGFSTYGFIFANSSTAVAVIVMCLTYILMIRKFRERFSYAGNNTFLSTRSESLPSQDQSMSNPSNTISSNTIMSSREKLEAKVTKMFLVVLIVLLCCYGPSTIMVYLINFCEFCNCTTIHWFRDLHAHFVIINSSINFFCYAFQSPRFRDAFMKLLKINKRRDRNISGNKMVVQSIFPQKNDEHTMREVVQGIANEQFDTSL